MVSREYGDAIGSGDEDVEVRAVEVIGEGDLEVGVAVKYGCVATRVVGQSVDEVEESAWLVESGAPNSDFQGPHGRLFSCAVRGW